MAPQYSVPFMPPSYQPAPLDPRVVAMLMAQRQQQQGGGQADLLSTLGQLGAGGGTGAAASGGSGAALTAPNIIHAGPAGSYAAGGGGATGAGIGASIGPAAAIAAGAYTGFQQATGAKDFVQGKRLTTPQKVALALPTFGTSLFSDQIQDAFGLGSKERFKTEQNRFDKLKKKGVTNLPSYQTLNKGRSRAELLNKSLPAEFIGMSPEGQWVNNKFSQSRDMADSEGRDWWGYSAHPELLGNAYMDASEQQRLDYNNRLLKENLLREHHGTVDYTDADKAKTIWDEIVGAKAASAPTPAPTVQRPATGPALPVSASKGKISFMRNIRRD